MTTNVDNVLNALTALTATFSPAEKQELLARLPGILGLVGNSSPNLTDSGQHMSNTLGNIQTGTGQSVLDYKPIQNQGGGTVNASDNIAQTYTKSPDMEKALASLVDLKQRIEQSDVNPLVKDGAKDKVEKLEAELNKPQPDKSFVQKTVETLKQGLEGVQTLAGSTLVVAKLIANAWGIPV